MDKDKVEKIKKALLDNPEIHVKLVGALTELWEKLGEKVNAEDLIAALMEATKAEGELTKNQEFFDHYMK